MPIYLGKNFLLTKGIEIRILLGMTTCPTSVFRVGKGRTTKCVNLLPLREGVSLKHSFLIWTPLLQSFFCSTVYLPCGCPISSSELGNQGSIWSQLVLVDQYFVPVMGTCSSVHCPLV